MPRCFALVPCAGSGLRAGTTERPKQYLPVAGRPMVGHTLEALAKVRRIEATLVVLAPGDAWFESLVGRAGEGLWLAHCGGPTRAESVANGLAELAQRGAGRDDWVLVHDAARCLVRPEWIERLIDECAQDAVGGLLALPVADTLKQAGEAPEPRVAATVERHGKWAAQTPQMFRLGLLREALARAGAEVTDESSAVEALGLAPRLVRGALENLKLTWAEDFDHAARLLAARRG